MPDLILRIIEDASSVFKTNDAVVSSMTRVGEAAGITDADVAKAASGQVASSLRVEKALQGQIAAYKALSVSAGATVEEQAKAAQLGALAQDRLARSQGTYVSGARASSAASRSAENDLGKLTRGALAGSGVISSLGRSLAFASGGFIAVAGGATLLHNAISDALTLASTQAEVDKQLQTTGKSWDQYKKQIQTALQAESNLSGFTNQDLLQSFLYLERQTGNVGTSLRLTSVAADVARGRNIALSSASLALAKALGGSSTALRRLGIIVPKTLKGMDALNFVAAKFAGQADAGATSADHLKASFVDASEIIGTGLLPTFNRLTGELTDWLAKMEESGRLQRDVNEAVSIAGGLFHTLGAVIKTVDEVTGSFKNTLELLVGLELGKLLLGWIGQLRTLATTWGLVEGAAVKAGAAQSTALAESGTAGGVAAGEGAAGAGALALSVPEIAAIVAAVIVDQRLSGPRQSLQDKLGHFGFLASGPEDAFKIPLAHALDAQRQLESLLFGNPPAAAPTGPRGPVGPTSGGGPLGPVGPVGPLTPGGTTSTVIFKSFTDTISNQLAQARASLTKSTADDVAAAKAEIAFIKREIAAGHLAGTSLIQALTAQATAVSTIEAAQAAAAQKIVTQIQNAIDPIKLEVALAKAQSLGQTGVPQLRRLLSAAYEGLAKALANGNQQLILAAYQQIKSLKDAIKTATTTAAKTFTEPMKLQIALAREQAFGKDTTQTLEEMKRAAQRALRSGKYTGQAEIDLLNEIANINSQLNSSAQNAYGDYKKASVKAETAGLGLTADQRRELEQRLSRRGPGGTTPASGTGAAGYVIDPATGRPVHAGHQRRGGARTPSAYDGSGGPYKETIVVKVMLDKKVLATATTVEQQRYRRNNPSSRRGPNAGSATA